MVIRDHLPEPMKSSRNSVYSVDPARTKAVPTKKEYANGQSCRSLGGKIRIWSWYGEGDAGHRPLSICWVYVPANSWETVESDDCSPKQRKPADTLFEPSCGSCRNFGSVEFRVDHISGGTNAFLHWSTLRRLQGKSGWNYQYMTFGRPQTNLT